MTKLDPADSQALGTAEEMIRTIVRMLGAADSERRVAAALVIAELRPETDEVMEALRRAGSRDDDVALRRSVVEAIGAIAPPTIVADLQPMISDSHRAVRAAVKRVLSSGRGVKESQVAKMLDATEERERLAAIAVLGAMGTTKSRRRLLGRLAGSSTKISGAIVDALRPGLVEASGKAARTAIEDIAAVLEPEKVASDPDFALAAIQLLGHVGVVDVGPVLLSLAQAEADVEVRVSALEAMQRVLRGRGHDKIFASLLDLVENGAVPSPTRAACLHVLANLQMPMHLEPRVRGLSTSESAGERRWALRALGGIDTAPAGEALAAVMESGSADDREIALEAGLKTPRGRGALAKLLGRVQDETRAAQVARGLRDHAGGLTPDTKHILENSVMTAPPEIGKLILQILKQGGGGTASRLQEDLLDKAALLKNKGQYQEAIAMLKSMTAGQDADPVAVFQLGVCEVKLSKRKIVRGATNNDACLATFQSLLRYREFPLLDRIRDDKTLDAEDLYYLAFSFAERSGVEQGFGGDLLAYLYESAPDSRLGGMAKNKLVTMGWLE